LSDAAQRLSLFIPLIASFVIFGEVLSGSKLAGIALALVALLCLLYRPTDKNQDGDTWKTILCLLAVWVGYGTIDILFKQMARSGAAFSSSLLVSFSLAGILIFAYLFVRRAVWTRRNIVAGVALGLL